MVLIFSSFFFSGSSSSDTNSIPHSFSVDEIQKIRTKLKSSKSYPNDFLKNQSNPQNHEEGDNSSSGVSSDQEVIITTNPIEIIKKSQIKLDLPIIKPILNPIPIVDDRSDDDDNSPSPPLKGFQRHNSLTRKQAATIAMNRSLHSRPAVSLAQLPPPMESESETETIVPINNIVTIGSNNHHGAADNIVLAPPPQFCDTVEINSSPRVRIVGAVPKANRLHSQ